jgi:hypothetical protein
VVGSRPTCGPAAAVVAAAEAVVAVVVHEVVVAAREEEEPVLHEVVAGRLAAAGRLAVAAGRGALRARRRCRVHPIHRIDAPAEVLEIELEATGRQRANCRHRAGPAASLETVPAPETGPAGETSLIGQALVIVQVPGQAWVIALVPARARSPARGLEAAHVRLAAIFQIFSIFQMPGAEMPVVAAYQAAWAVPRPDSAARWLAARLPSSSATVQVMHCPEKVPGLVPATSRARCLRVRAWVTVSDPAAAGPMSVAPDSLAIVPTTACQAKAAIARTSVDRDNQTSVDQDGQTSDNQDDQTSDSQGGRTLVSQVVPISADQEG